MDSRGRNITIWDDLYNRNAGDLNYPDTAFVTVAHRLLKNNEHRTILDYGFGSGANMIHLAKQGYNVSGVEVSAVAIERMHDRLARLSLSGDLRRIVDGKIPFEDDRFDAVVAWQVLYYNDWESLSAATAEIDRVLRPGGVFLGTMAAPGDYSHTHSTPLGNSLFQSNVPGQSGCTVLVVEEDELGNCFPRKMILKGHSDLQFRDRRSRHWIISYEN